MANPQPRFTDTAESTADTAFFSPFHDWAMRQPETDHISGDASDANALSDSAAPTACSSSSSAAPGMVVPATFAFARLCRLFEQLERAVNKAQQVRALTALWKLLPPQHSFFPYMRLLMPHLDTQRPSYHLKESKLAAIYVEVLALSRKGTDAHRLLHWKDPTTTGLSAHPAAAVEASMVGGGPAPRAALHSSTSATHASASSTHFSDVVFNVLEHTGGYQPPTAVLASAVKGETPPPQASSSSTTTAGTLAASNTPPAELLQQDTRLGGVSVAAVNTFLDALAAADSAGRRTALFQRVVCNTTPLEQKWLLRIILKDMHFRMTHQSMLAVFHPSALDKLSTTSDLRYVCDSCLQEIQQPHVGSAECGVVLFQPLKPMLASPVTARKMEQLLATEQIVLEPKYDGERIMLHMDGQRTTYWTRNAKNFTSYYAPKFDGTARAAFPVGVQRSISALSPGTASTGFAAPTASATTMTLRNCILDGEILIYDRDTESYLDFGQNRAFATAGEAAVASGVVDGERQWFCYVVFDIVLLNGQSLLQVPLMKRRALLREVLSEQPTHMEVITSQAVHTTAEILTGLEKAIEAKHEGVVLKMANSPYVPAERKLRWIKLKPDHIAGLADTLDLIIVGGFYGTKFGRKHISHFLLASPLREAGARDGDVDHNLYHTVCKIGTGYTKEELVALQAALEPHWERMPSRQVIPAWLDKWYPAKTELLPDVYVHPRHSLVVEVFGFAFTETVNYRVGFTLRFPRLLRLRWDKSVSDATTVTHLCQIRDASKDALRRRLADTQDELLTVLSMKWKRRRESTTTPTSATASSFAGPHPTRQGEESLSCGDDSNTLAALPALDPLYALQPQPFATAISGGCEVTQRVRPEEVVSRLFAGYEFCILYIAPGSAQVWRGSDSTAFTQSEAPAAAVVSSMNDRAVVEHQLQRYGGRVVANPTRTTSLLIANSTKATKVVNWVQLCESKPAHVATKYAATDVVHLQWLVDCVAAGRVLPLAPRYVLYTSPALKHKFAQLLDKYECAWYDPCTPESLRYSIAVATRLRREAARKEGGALSEDNSNSNSGSSAGALTAQRQPNALAAISRRVRAYRIELGLSEASTPSCPTPGAFAIITPVPAREVPVSLSSSSSALSAALRGASRHSAQNACTAASVELHGEELNAAVELFLAQSPCARLWRAREEQERKDIATAAAAPASRPPSDGTPSPHPPTGTVKREATLSGNDGGPGDGATHLGAPVLMLRHGVLEDERSGTQYLSRTDVTDTWTVDQLLQVTTRLLRVRDGAFLTSDLAEATSAVDDNGKWWFISR